MARSYCEDCLSTLAVDRVELRDLWEEVGSPGLAQGDACRALHLLHRVSHGRILAMLGERVARYYPTPKRYPGRLEGDGPLWWVFHATGGVSIKPVLTWFSGRARRAPGLKDGEVLRPRGGSAHFVVDLDGSPWGIVPVTDGAWHCRGRNFDSLSLELVNACSLTRKEGRSGTSRWRWWAGDYRLPYQPQAAPLWRGARWWQPYLASQLLTTARLVRLCQEALGRQRFDPVRTSQHSQWAARKLDCGPLFPQRSLVEAALGEAPLQEYEWFATLTRETSPSPSTGAEGAWAGWLGGQPSEPPPEEAISRQELASLFSYCVFLDAEGAPRDVEDGPAEADHQDLLRRVQEALRARGLYTGQIDGIYGRQTREAVRSFQIEWNSQRDLDHPRRSGEEGGQLVVDGIPGPLTRSALFGQPAR